MSFLKVIDTKVIFYIFVGTLLIVVPCLLHYLKVSSLENKISTLETDKSKLQEDLIKEKTNFQRCDDKREEQNKQIEELKVEVTYKEPVSLEKVQNVYVKDKTCEAELKAYKELFND